MLQISFLHIVLLLICNRGKSEVYRNSQEAELGDIENSDIAKCGDSTKLLPILPGFGWDGLQGKTLSRVLKLTYSQCKTTTDGFFLIPDEVYAVPIKEYVISTQYIEDWRDFKNILTKSFVTGTKYPLLDVAYTNMFHLIKERQTKFQESAMLVEMRYTMYRVTIERNADMVPLLKMLFLRAANAITENDESMAEYLLEYIVRDYGTHFITSVDAGGILLQEDFLSKERIDDKQLKKAELSVLALASFKNAFQGLSEDIDLRSTSDLHESELQIYDSVKRHNATKLFGGTPLDITKNIQLWGSSVRDNMVGIDQRGDPLHQLITSTYFSTNVTDDLRAMLQKIMEKYYAVNIHKGCTDKDDPNFDSSANVDDDSCERPFSENTFGGMYQTCSSGITDKVDLCQTNYLNRVNPITQNYSCPSAYFSWNLLNQSVSLTTTSKDCWDSCDGFWVFKTCRQQCKTLYHYNEARYITYWCVPRDKLSTSKGYLFGGVYSSSSSNNITNSKSCPPTFNALSIGEDIKVCASLDHAAGYKYYVPFGGFYSCSKPNPFSAMDPHSMTYRKQCPSGYIANSVRSSQHCILYYCSQARKLPKTSKLPMTLIRPPFTNFNDTLYASVVNESLNLISMINDPNLNFSDSEVMTAENNLCHFPVNITSVNELCQIGITEINVNSSDGNTPVFINCENGTVKIRYINGNEITNVRYTNETNFNYTVNENVTTIANEAETNGIDDINISADYEISVLCANNENISFCKDHLNVSHNIFCGGNDNETLCNKNVTTGINIYDENMIMDAQNGAPNNGENIAVGADWNTTNISGEAVTELGISTQPSVTILSRPETIDSINFETMKTPFIIGFSISAFLVILAVVGFWYLRKRQSSMKVDNSQISLHPV